MGTTGKQHVLLIIENASVPNDMRVWKEARTVKDLGYDVSIISPRGGAIDTEPYVQMEGIDVYRYRQVVIGGGFLSYVVEYSNALLRVAALVCRINSHKRVNIFHIGNPPDIFFTLVFWFRIFGAQYIFDVHDLFVNTFQSKFQDRKSILKSMFVGLLRIIERLNVATADLVIATNVSYREYILTTHHRLPGEVFVVRNAPRLDKRNEVPPDPALKRGKRNLVVYFGNFGEDDGVDAILRAMHHVTVDRGFTDIHCTLIGSTEREASPAIDALRELHAELHLESCVEFTGYLPWVQVHTLLRTADVGLSPDPFTPQNNTSTMQKIMEYMSHGLPILSFNLKENRYSGGDAAEYCADYDYRTFGDAMIALLNDPQKREAMSREGLRRYQTEFNWSASEKNLAEVYRHIRTGTNGTHDGE
jgi:glycosyltransferase involved in cell wall biosynthesis